MYSNSRFSIVNLYDLYKSPAYTQALVHGLDCLLLSFDFFTLSFGNTVDFTCSSTFTFFLSTAEITSLATDFNASVATLVRPIATAHPTTYLRTVSAAGSAIAKFPLRSINETGLLLEYTDKIERFSIDECFLDMTNCLMGKSLLDKAYEINKRVKEELGFTVNVGVAHNKLLAKMASDFTKPDRVHTLYENEIPTKMWCLPISDLLMLGRKTIPKLYNMGIKTIGQLAYTDKQLLTNKFGKHGKMMWEYANGIDESEVQYKFEKPKGIGNSTTLPVDLSEISKLEEVLLALTEQVTYRLRKYDMVANVVNVQLRSKDFEDKTHQRKLSFPTASTREIYALAKELFKEMYKQGTPIRLIGMRVDNLEEKEKSQISLFDYNDNEKREKLDKVVDDLKQKYGYNSITRAGKLHSEDKIKLKDI